MLQIHTFEMNPFGVDTYIVYDPDSREAAIVDPGMLNDAERDAIRQYVSAHNLNVRHLLNTHLHIDHCLGSSWVANRYGVPVSAGAADIFLGERLQAQADAFHMPVSNTPSLSVDKTLADGDRLTIGKDEIEVLAVPGHSPGSIAFYCPASGFVITGDTLFNGSIGRADLPGGDLAQLVSAIRIKLMTLPDSTVVYPGHGPSTTIGYERTHNPYL